MTTQRTNNLIETLAADCTPVKRVLSVWATFGMLLLTAAAGGLLWYSCETTVDHYLGVIHPSAPPAYLLKYGCLTLFAAISSTLALAALSRPDTRWQKPSYAIAGISALTLVYLLIDTRMLNHQTEVHLACITSTLVASLVFCALLFKVLRRSVTVHPALMASYLGLTATAYALTVRLLFCSITSAEYALASHLAIFPIVAGLCYLLLKRKLSS